MTTEGSYIAIGALLGLAAVLDGALVVRPTANKIAKVCSNLLQSPGTTSEDLPGLVKRLGATATVGMVLLILTLVFMVGATWT